MFALIAATLPTECTDTESLEGLQSTLHDGQAIGDHMVSKAACILKKSLTCYNMRRYPSCYGTLCGR